MQGVQDSLIDSCSLTQNTTGVLLNGVSGVTCNDVVSYKNSNAGFDLLKSYTTVLNNCQALSTGQGNNTVTKNNVYGFVSETGFGNIFENCIANATQALSTTDQASIVAGFALLGTGTQCNKIIGCESANTRTSANGNTVPYGIYLQPNFQGFFIENSTTVTTAVQIANYQPLGADWSPDGQYVAITAWENTLSGDELTIVKYDRVNQILNQVANVGVANSFNGYSVRWHPSGSFIAEVGSFYVNIFYFDALNEQATFVYQLQGYPNGNHQAYDCFWSPDGQYLVVVGENGNTGTAQELKLYKFDSVQRIITQVQALTNGQPIYGVSWSPNGQYVVIGAAIGTISGASAGLVVMPFNGKTLTTPVSSNFYVSGLAFGRVAWSPDGQYIATADTSSAPYIYIYQFNPTTGLTFITSFDSTNLPDNQTTTVRWSPDGKYIVFSSLNASRTSAVIYQFNRDTKALTLASSITTTAATFPCSAAWSPDGELIFVALATRIYNIYHAMTFPSGNVVTNNVVYNNTNGTPGAGVIGAGISGSSASNTIIKNNTYNNAFNTIFVANLYNQLFQDAPTYLQNEALVNNNPILEQIDMLRLLKQIETYSRSLYDKFL